MDHLPLRFGVVLVGCKGSSVPAGDIAAAAANLTKAQVLQQTSLAALSQANSAPQAVLSLLKNLS